MAARGGRRPASQPSVHPADRGAGGQEAASPAPGRAALPPGVCAGAQAASSSPEAGPARCPALVPVENANPSSSQRAGAWSWGVLAPQCGCQEGSGTNDVPSQAPLSRHPPRCPMRKGGSVPPAAQAAVALDPDLPRVHLCFSIVRKGALKPWRAGAGANESHSCCCLVPPAPGEPKQGLWKQEGGHEGKRLC